MKFAYFERSLGYLSEFAERAEKRFGPGELTLTDQLSDSFVAIVTLPGVSAPGESVRAKIYVDFKGAEQRWFICIEKAWTDASESFEIAPRAPGFSAVVEKALDAAWFVRGIKTCSCGKIYRGALDHFATTDCTKNSRRVAYRALAKALQRVSKKTGDPSEARARLRQLGINWNPQDGVIYALDDSWALRLAQMSTTNTRLTPALVAKFLIGMTTRPVDVAALTASTGQRDIALVWNDFYRRRKSAHI